MYYDAEEIDCFHVVVVYFLKLQYYLLVAWNGQDAMEECVDLWNIKVLIVDVDEVVLHE